MEMLGEEALQVLVAPQAPQVLQALQVQTAPTAPRVLVALQVLAVLQVLHL